jgi:tripartite-type tricarboxylate transporter receptor subunit TctC
LLSAEILRALGSPTVREAVENSGGETVGNTPVEFAALIEQNAQKYAKLVEISGAEPN